MDNRDYRDDYREDYRDYRDYRDNYRDYRRDYDRRGGRINNRNYREQDFYDELEMVCQDMKEQARKLEDIAEMSKNPQERAMLMKISQTEKDHVQGLKKIVEG